MSLKIVYQKIFTRDKQIFGCEALSRFYDNGKQLDTYKTIKELEVSDKINEVSKNILDMVLTKIDADPNINLVFINISVKQLENPFAIKYMLNTVSNSGHINKVGFEILEDYIDYNNPIVADNLKLLQQSGCLIAIDDFGTRAASLERLFIPCSIIKVDRMFLEPDKRYVLDTLPSLIHKSNKIALIEGIEAEEQLEYVYNIGFDCFQGFLLDDIRN